MMTPRRLTSIQIIIKLSKVKDRVLKSSKRKATHYRQGSSHKITAVFSAEALQARCEQDNIFKVLRGKNLPAKNIISGKTILQKWSNKHFPDKQKLKDFIH